jgi:hypothetical protein
MRYKVLVHISHDAKATSFDTGDTIGDDDFDTDVIENWLQIGVLETIEENEKPKRRKSKRAKS